jgi:8-amino-7-oxononanoate synthase
MEDRYKLELQQLREEGLYRQMRVLASGADSRVQIDGRPMRDFCSNNYLGLANHPEVIAAVKKGLDAWGFGSGGSRLVCGNMAPHQRLEGRLAAWLGKEACLIFPSGYAANHAILTTLPGKNDLVVIDKLVHASIIDGAQAGPATVRTWPHRQTEKLRKLLDRGGYEQAFIVTDSLFSMDGDFAPLAELAEIKKKYNAMLVVDEAHAFGCIGPEGAGYAAEKELSDAVDIMIATFSKTLGGAGGFVASSRTMVDYLINKARGFIFTTGIPAVNCLAAEAALDLIQREPQRRQRLIDQGRYLRERCRERGWDTGGSESYIVPVILGSAERAVEVSRRLFERGFFVPAIRPPTVPPAGSRLRISLMSEHTHKDIDELCDTLQNIGI